MPANRNGSDARIPPLKREKPRQRAPRRATGIPRSRGTVLLNPRELLRAHGRMIFRAIAIPRMPRGRPDDAQRAEDDEARAPGPPGDEQQSHRRREHAADPRAEEHDAVRAPALAHGKPAREASRDVGEGARLAGAEQKPDGDERVHPARRGGEHCECRPPQHNPCQHSPPRWRSSMMYGAAAEIQIRSRYVTTASRNANARTRPRTQVAGGIGW